MGGHTVTVTQPNPHSGLDIGKLNLVISCETGHTVPGFSRAHIDGRWVGIMLMPLKIIQDRRHPGFDLLEIHGRQVFTVKDPALVSRCTLAGINRHVGGKLPQIVEHCAVRLICFFNHLPL